ncbi:MAG TPA: hypothetical protein VLV82_03520 [Candidatus Angelobacter sp.]|nr:hypothetical protein [Candidatus Angelobacter sp.]
MRKNLTVVHATESRGHERTAPWRESLPRRRRQALKAENAKARAQSGLPAAWLH